MILQPRPGNDRTAVRVLRRPGLSRSVSDPVGARASPIRWQKPRRKPPAAALFALGAARLALGHDPSDHVVRAGRTFRYTPEEPVGLLRDKRAVLVLTRGSIHSGGPARAPAQGSSRRPRRPSGAACQPGVVPDQQQRLRALVDRLLHNGVLRWSTPKVNLTENPRFTVLEPQMVRC